MKKLALFNPYSFFYHITPFFFINNKNNKRLDSKLCWALYPAGLCVFSLQIVIKCPTRTHYKRISIIFCCFLSFFCCCYQVCQRLFHQTHLLDSLLRLYIRNNDWKMFKNQVLIHFGQRNKIPIRNFLN